MAAAYWPSDFELAADGIQWPHRLRPVEQVWSARHDASIIAALGVIMMHQGAYTLDAEFLTGETMAAVGVQLPPLVA